MIPVVAALLNAGLGILGNAVATKGKDFIEKKLDVKIDDMLGSEEGKIKLAQLEAENEQALMEFSLKERELELEAVKLEHANTDSARDMQVAALQQTDIFAKRYIYYLASAWTLAAMAYIGFITFGTIPADNVRFADTILGFILGTIISTIVNFFFGSSTQSRSKDAALAEAIKGK